MRSERTSILFLMEIITVVLFFAICASICIRAFAGADMMSRDADRLNMAVIRTESTAELWNAGKICADGEAKEILYDGQWNETTEEANTVYKMILTEAQQSNSMEYCTISIKEDNDIIYSLDIGRYDLE